MKTTYVDPAKQRWHRAANFAVIDELLHDKPIRYRRVIYLDTREALQTMQLLKHGYQPENLLAVNVEPIEMALLTQKLSQLNYPRVLTRIGRLEDVTWGTPTDVLDFDGTGNLRGSIGNDLLANAVYGSTPKVVSFAISVGREHDETMSRIDAYCENHRGAWIPATTSSGRPAPARCWWRLHYCLHNAIVRETSSSVTCLWHVVNWYWDVYRSTSGHTIAWLSARILPHRHHSTLKAQQQTEWFRRVFLYGLAPECGLVDSIEEAAGCPAWSDAQFQYCGYYPEEMARISRELHPGWPTR